MLLDSEFGRNIGLPQDKWNQLLANGLQLRISRDNWPKKTKRPSSPWNEIKL